MNVGTHALFEITFKNNDLLTRHDLFFNLLKSSCEEAGATVRETHVEYFDGTDGFTIMMVLAESHASVHTWPEHNLACFDIFMCGECDAHATMEEFVGKLKKQTAMIDKYHMSKVFRGYVHEHKEDTETVLSAEVPAS